MDALDANHSDVMERTLHSLVSQLTALKSQIIRCEATGPEKEKGSDTHELSPSVDACLSTARHALKLHVTWCNLHDKQHEQDSSTFVESINAEDNEDDDFESWAAKETLRLSLREKQRDKAKASARGICSTPERKKTNAVDVSPLEALERSATPAMGSRDDDDDDCAVVGDGGEEVDGMLANIRCLTVKSPHSQCSSPAIKKTCRALSPVGIREPRSPQNSVKH